MWPRKLRPCSSRAGTNREAAETLISEIYSKSADMESFVGDLLQQLKYPETSELIKYFSSKLNTDEGKVNIAIQILALAGVPAHGLVMIRASAYCVCRFTLIQSVPAGKMRTVVRTMCLCTGRSCADS